MIQFSAEDTAGLATVGAQYADLPMSLADACLVRMTELAPQSQVLTTDRHFRIYRRHGRHHLAPRAVLGFPVAHWSIALYRRRIPRK